MLFQPVFGLGLVAVTCPECAVRGDASTLARLQLDDDERWQIAVLERTGRRAAEHQCAGTTVEPRRYRWRVDTGRPGRAMTLKCDRCRTTFSRERRELWARASAAARAGVTSFEL